MTSLPPAHASRDPRWLWAVAVACVVLGFAAFMTRGFLASFDVERSGNADWRLVYAASRAWLVGELPYNAESVRRAFAAAGTPPGLDAMNTRTSDVLVYPPPALVVVSPIAALPWGIASPLWTFLTVAMYAVATWAIAALAGLTAARRWIFFGLAMLLSPIHALLWQGQTAVPVLMGVALASLIIHRSLPAGARLGAAGSSGLAGPLAGVLLGVASVLKPQLGLVFLVYHLGRRRWSVAVWGAATMALLTTIGGLRMWAAGITWMEQYVTNLRAFTSVSDASPMSNNWVRYHLLNMHYPLHTILGDTAPVEPIVFGIVAAASLWYLFHDWRDDAARGERRALGHEMLSLSMCSAVTLVVAYHRIYDAIVLLIPMAMLLATRWRGLTGGCRVAVTTLWVIILSFLGPWPVVMTRLADQGRAPAWLTQSWAWDRLIVPGHAWGLVVMMLLLVWLRWRVSARAGRAE